MAPSDTRNGAISHSLSLIHVTITHRAIQPSSLREIRRPNQTRRMPSCLPKLMRSPTTNRALCPGSTSL